MNPQDSNGSILARGSPHWVSPWALPSSQQSLPKPSKRFIYLLTKKHDEYVVLVHAMILLVYDQNTSSMVDIKKT